jgi:putative glutamine amidotransferase
MLVGMDGVPLIAVTSSEMRANALAVTPEADPPRDEMVLGLRYLQALSSAGCLPVVAPPLEPGRIDDLLDRVDGICLSGGPDLSPAAYGEQPHPRLGPTEPDLDAFELTLVRAADRRGMPVLAICRGAQLLNVVRGGTLHQHLPDIVGTAIEHRQLVDGAEPTHEVTLTRSGTLTRALGAGKLCVNSFHHQAVDRLGDGLRVVGRARDDVVEAFEDTGARFVVGVQWHAESLVRRPEQTALFRAFAVACGAAGEARPARSTCAL